MFGGKMKRGENIEQCIVRELLEELSIIVRTENVTVSNLAYTTVGAPMIQIGALINDYEGQPRIM